MNLKKYLYLNIIALSFTIFTSYSMEQNSKSLVQQQIVKIENTRKQCLTIYAANTLAKNQLITQKQISALPIDAQEHVNINKIINLYVNAVVNLNEEEWAEASKAKLLEFILPYIENKNYKKIKFFVDVLSELLEFKEEISNSQLKYTYDSNTWRDILLFAGKHDIDEAEDNYFACYIANNNLKVLLKKMTENIDKYINLFKYFVRKVDLKSKYLPSFNKTAFEGLIESQKINFEIVKWLVKLAEKSGIKAEELVSNNIYDNALILLTDETEKIQYILDLYIRSGFEQGILEKILFKALHFKYPETIKVLLKTLKINDIVIEKALYIAMLEQLDFYSCFANLNDDVEAALSRKKKIINLLLSQNIELEEDTIKAVQEYLDKIDDILNSK